MIPGTETLAVVAKWRRRQDVADVGTGAVSRIEVVTAGDETFQLRLEYDELGLSRPYGVELAAEQSCHMGAWGISVISNLDYACDLGKGEPGGLRAADEEHAGDARGVVGAVAVGCPSWFGQKALTLVEPDGLAVQPNGLGELSDQHPFNLPLDLVACNKVYVSRMEIILLYFDGCPNWKVADDRLAVIAAERPEITVTRHLVETFDEAERVAFHGSPSIFVDGVDPFADAGAGVGLACRIYQTPQGPAGAPTLEQLRSAVAHA